MNKNDFLNAIRRAEKRVDLDGVVVAVKQLLVADQNAQREFREQNENPVLANAFLVSRSLYSLEGARIFDDGDLEDVQKIPAHAFELLLKEIMAINGWDEAEPAKNS